MTDTGLRENIKEGLCSNCKMQDMAVCEACQIDFEKAIDQILQACQGAICEACLEGSEMDGCPLPQEEQKTCKFNLRRGEK